MMIVATRPADEATRRQDEQEADLQAIDRNRLQRALQAALRRCPSPRELRRAWLAWQGEG